MKIRRLHIFSVPWGLSVVVGRVFADSHSEALRELQDDDPLWKRGPVHYHGITDWESEMPAWASAHCQPVKRAYFEHKNLVA